MSRNYSEEIASAVREHLDDKGWTYRFEDDNGVFRFGLNISGNLRSIQYLIDIRDTDYNVYAVSPLSADKDNEDQLRRMSEAVNRINYGLRDGNFELDLNDGEIRYKSYVNCEDSSLSEAMVRRSIGVPAAMFTRYSKAIIGIIFSDGDPKDLVDQCEGGGFAPSSGDSGDRPLDREALLRRLRSLQGASDDDDDK